MSNTSIFRCIMTIVPNFTIIFIFSMFVFKSLCTNVTICLHFDIVFAVQTIFFFLLKFNYPIACSLKDPQNLFMQSLPLYTLNLFSILSNDDIVDIEKLGEICSPTFVVGEFSRLFLLPSIFSIKHSRSL